MAKQVYECNWVPSHVTESQLDDLVLIGALDSKDTIHWRVPEDQCPPTPQEGEVMVFADHMARGFKPPGSKFYRDVLANFQLRPQDTGPNSVTNLCHFQVLSEAYLQEEPSVELFRDLFHLNRVLNSLTALIPNWAVWPFRRGKKSPTLTSNSILTPRSGMQLGFIARIPPLTMKIPCLASVRNGSATLTLFHKG